MKYIWYEPTTNQIMAEGESENLPEPTSWDALGYIRVILPEGMRKRDASRDHKVLLDIEGQIVSTEPSLNSIQPIPYPEIAARADAKASGMAKLRALGLTDAEIGAL
jgi:hypothetical protein